MHRHRSRSGACMISSPHCAHAPQVHRVCLRYASVMLARCQGHATSASRSMSHHAPHRRLRLPLRPLAPGLPSFDSCCERHQTKPSPVHRHRGRARPGTVDSSSDTYGRAVYCPAVGDASGLLCCCYAHTSSSSGTMTHHASYCCL